MKKFLFLTLLLFPSVCFAEDTLITSWQSGHGWTLAYGTATVTDDTGVFYTGTQSLKVVTGGSEEDYIGIRKTFSPTLDLTADNIKLIARSPNWDNCGGLKVEFTSNAWAGTYSWNFTTGLSSKTDNAWVEFSIPLSSMVALGSPASNISAINAGQVFFADYGSACTAYLGALYSVPSGIYHPICIGDQWGVTESPVAATAVSDFIITKRVNNSTNCQRN